jgi:putative effector of murein hydrolase LrgA (UPF0299 family)
MIRAFAALLLCQLAGETLVRLLSLPLPGPVAGFGLLFAGLLWRGGMNGAPPRDLAATADGLLRNLSILFVPAAVGIMQRFDVLRQQGFALAVALVGSTLLTLAVTALAFQAMSRRAARAP